VVGGDPGSDGVPDPSDDVLFGGPNADDLLGADGDDLSLSGRDNDDKVNGGLGRDTDCTGSEPEGGADIDGVPDDDVVRNCERLR
jgi:hypothetical protein